MPPLFGGTRYSKKCLIVFVQTAKGELFVDDGDSLNTYKDGRFTHVRFVFKKSELKSIVEHSGFVIVELVGKIEIFGLNDLDEITSVTCNDQQAQFSKDPDAKVSSVQLSKC